MTWRIRTAQLADLAQIVSLLKDDKLGAGRESLGEEESSAYSGAMHGIDADPNNELLVAVMDKHIIAVLQITYIPNLTYQGAWRAMIEGVRVHRDYRSQKIGEEMIKHAINRARDRHCKIVQLTCDKRRPRALSFYRQLGFESTHEGFKLWF